MRIHGKMVLNIICLFIGLHAACAWLAPERCQQSDAIVPNPNASSYAAHTVVDINEIAREQNEIMQAEFNDTKFLYIPSRGAVDPNNDLIFICLEYEISVAHSCQFETYQPNLLSSVYCQDGLDCKLKHIVSTTASYEATEGYNWGTKVTTKGGFRPFFEVGAEASTGGSYTCSYTRSKTEVECSSPTGGTKTLALYLVRTDMNCEFCRTTMVRDKRADQEYFTLLKEELPLNEIETISRNPILISKAGNMLPNWERVPITLMEKLTKQLPYYDPYKDMINLIGQYVSYFKFGSMTKEYKQVIPFTKQNGDSVYQYDCLQR